MSSVKAKIATSCMVYVDSDSTAAGLIYLKHFTKIFVKLWVVVVKQR